MKIKFYIKLNFWLIKYILFIFKLKNINYFGAINEIKNLNSK